MEENPQSTSTLVASENEVSQTIVLRILRKENYHPYKFQLVQELNEDDPDRRLQFYSHDSIQTFRQTAMHTWLECSLPDNKELIKGTLKVRCNCNIRPSTTAAGFNIFGYISSVDRIFKQNRNLPFKPKFRHTLEEGDEAKRLDFCLKMGNRVLNDILYIAKIREEEDWRYSEYIVKWLHLSFNLGAAVTVATKNTSENVCAKNKTTKNKIIQLV
ncbi:hypothetical protein NQ318_001764 [Aromia moschata]|uniref:Uncharacterized protein n=1 Tax=Aromia moschata TaxID=1265417 RepID=A0AAV8X9B1_9CUCU|nr:hypothetical protein NQ318_001764 [Aromia moschata]